MNNINEIIQSSSETGNGSGLRFIPAQWDETGETVGYNVTTISDTIDDDLGFTVKIRQISSENAYDDLDNPAWTVQVNSSRGGSPEIPCDSLIEAYKTTMMWYAGFCEGRVLQSEKDAVKIAHMMLKNDVENDVDPGFLGVDGDLEALAVPYDTGATPKKHSIRGLMGWLASLIY